MIGIVLKKILRFQRRNLQILSQINQYATAVAEPQYSGSQNTFTNNIQFFNKNSYNSIPIYRINNLNGETQLPKDLKLSNETMIEMYKKMVMLSIMDNILYESQRQGRISFYMTNIGEEALQIGSAAAFTVDDMIYAQYREAGVLFWRGYPLSKFMNQCYSNHEDEAKGRQMPVHYGSKELNFVTISSPLTTQLPQAVGAAYAFKRDNKDACVVCYFGEGAASEGDAHAAFNFAATLECPIIFICRNNGYAISTPTSQQYKGDGIAARGPAYGIDTLRVDGNDIIAMYHATKVARDFCINEKKPVLIEAMTYRIGSHSTSDDSTAYRTHDEVSKWLTISPIVKFRKYLESLGIWNAEYEKEVTTKARKDILTAFSDAENKQKPHWNESFTDVYDKMPIHLRNQLNSMEKHLREYGEHYPLQAFKST